MSREQLNYFYDIDKINSINQKIEKINNDTSLSQDCKLDAVIAFLEDLDPDDRREYEHYKRTVINEVEFVENKTLCLEKYKGKIVLIELVNLQQSYNKLCAMVGNIGYIQRRFDEYDAPEEEKQAIKKFLLQIYGGASDKYISTVYDLFYKNNKAKRPDYVPEIAPDVLGDLMPAIDQVMNVYNYLDVNIEAIRGVVSALFGIRASHEATIHVHGVFDSVDDPELLKYRLNNANKFNSATELLPVPFGNTYLFDKFKQLRSNVVLFNSSDPDIEILHSNRLMTDMNSHSMFKKRLNNLEGRMSKDQLSAISGYRKEIDRLKNAPAGTIPKVDQKLVKLRSKIDKAYEDNTKETEVITDVIKLSGGKAVKKRYTTEATD